MTAIFWLVAGSVLSAPMQAVEEQVPRGAAVGAEGSALPKPAQSKMAAVTVYRNNALVTREVTVPAGQGPFELVVTPLPSRTIENSLSAEANDGLSILSTRFRARAVARDLRQEVRTKEDELKALELESQRIQSQIAVIDQDQQFLQKLEGFTNVSLAQLTDKGQLDSDGVLKMGRFVMDTRAKRALEQVALKQQLQAKSEAAEFAKRKLTELTAGSSHTEYDAVIVVNKTNAEAATVRLNYLVGASGWNPVYRLRAGGEKDKVQVEYLGAITQQSGEDWSNVELTLSTSEPALNASPPELLPLDMFMPSDDDESMASGGFGGSGMGAMGAGSTISNPNNQAAQQALGTTPSNGGVQLNQAAAEQQIAELTVKDGNSDDANPRRAGPSVTYHLASRLSLLSRNDPQLVEVAKLEMTPDYFDKAVPVLTPHVYRLAKLTNNSDYVLLPGEATMYLGSDFVGRMQLPQVAKGELFVAGFGVDPQVQIFRRLVNKSRTYQGGNQVYTYEFRLAVRNYRPDPVKLQLWDRLPKPHGESAAVNLVRTSTAMSEDPIYKRNGRADNLLRWDLEVPAGTVLTNSSEKTFLLNYEFRMEYARDLPNPLLSSGALKEAPIGMGGMGGMGGFRSVDDPPQTRALERTR